MYRAHVFGPIMLGFFGIQRRWMSSVGNDFESLYGWTETGYGEEKYD